MILWKGDGWIAKEGRSISPSPRTRSKKRTACTGADCNSFESFILNVIVRLRGASRRLWLVSGVHFDLYFLCKPSRENHLREWWMSKPFAPMNWKEVREKDSGTRKRPSLLQNPRWLLFQGPKFYQTNVNPKVMLVVYSSIPWTSGHLITIFRPEESSVDTSWESLP